MKQRPVAHVTVATGEHVILSTTGADKPSLSSEILSKWQKLIDLAARVSGYSVSCLACFHADALEILLASGPDSDRFTPGDSEPLNRGLPCETVAATRQPLEVPDLGADAAWRSHQKNGHGMTAYFGMPLLWPDGELFGTLCAVNRTAHTLSDLQRDLLAHFREVVESDLHRLVERQTLQQMHLDQDMAVKEAHHRIKNHLNMLTGVLQLSRDKQTDDPGAFNALIDDLSNRIRSVAALHSQISQADNADIDLGEFITDIATTIVHSIADRDVALTVAAPPFQVSHPTFFRTGLLISELVTNSLKHAFHDTPAPAITITIADIDATTFHIRYNDNGVGLPDDFDPAQAQSIGMLLIQDLPSHMNGTCELKKGHGACFEFVLDK